MDKEKREWSTYLVGAGFTIMIIFLLLSMFGNKGSFIAFCGIIVGAILGTIGLIINKMEQVNDKEKVRKNQKEMSEWFESRIVGFGLCVDDIISIKKKEYSIYISQKYYYWIKDKKIFFFPQKEDFIRWHVNINNSVDYCEENAKLISINISDIVYFKVIGDISYVTNVESSGINVKGAAIGAVVAGDAGAIIGSRPKITSKVEEKDNRFVELKYKDDETIKTLKFDYTALDIFREIIPEKEYEYAGFTTEKVTEQAQEDTANSYTIEERFKKLNDLKHAGLITEEEFANKKKELLEQI